MKLSGDRMRCWAETAGLIRLYYLLVLYSVRTGLVYENASSIVEVKRNPERYLGKVICLSSNGIGGAISIQEIMKLYGACGYK